MTNFTELDNVGPTRRDYIKDAGYETMGELAQAKPSELADEIDTPDDTALEIIVQAENRAEDADDGSEEDEEEDEVMPEDLAEDDESDDSDESAASDDNEESERISFEIHLDEDIHYDAYMFALLNAHQSQYGAHQPTVDAIKKALNDVRGESDVVSHEFTPRELNTIHSYVSQQVNNYKGSNMIEHMDAMNEILEQINETRDY